MSVKYIKIRFNTDDPSDRELLDRLKGMEGQNKFIKNALHYYLKREKETGLINEIVDAVSFEIQKAKLTPTVLPANNDLSDDTAIDESIDIADAFLDSL